jgi:hypothetical protein
MSRRESDIQFLARGLYRALGGMGGAYSERDFERLHALIEHGEQPELEPDEERDITHARPA